MGTPVDNGAKLTEVEQLTKEGKTLPAIVAATGLKVASVRYYQAVLRKAGKIPYLRPPADKVTRPTRVDGIHAVRVEEIEIVTCPRCKTQIQVVR